MYATFEWRAEYSIFFWFDYYYYYYKFAAVSSNKAKA